MSNERVGVRIRLGRRSKSEARALPDVAAACEEAGADAFYLAHDDAIGPDERFDPFVLLGACATTTERVGLGYLAPEVSERPPSLLAKVATSLDVCSGGRALAALSARSFDGRLAEALEVLRALSRLEAPSFKGRSFALQEAFNEPKRMGDTSMPIGLLLGELDADDERLELAARFCEMAFLSPKATALLKDIVTAFSASCRRAGRLPGSAALFQMVEATDEMVVEVARNALAVGVSGVVLDASFEDAALVVPLLHCLVAKGGVKSP